MTKIPQYIIDELKEQQSKSPSKKKKVGCVILLEDKIYGAGYNKPHSSLEQWEQSRIEEGDSTRYWSFQYWQEELSKRAKKHNKEDFVHAELLACMAYHCYIKQIMSQTPKGNVTVYITHQPCEVCDKYLNEYFEKPNIVVVDMDNQPTTDEAEARPKDYYTLPNGDKILISYPDEINTITGDINTPKDYYTLPNNIEAKDVLQYFPYNLGAAMKYIWRAGKKDTNQASDLNKAMDYLILEMIRLGIKRKSNLSKELLEGFNNKCQK